MRFRGFVIKRRHWNFSGKECEWMQTDKIRLASGFPPSTHELEDSHQRLYSSGGTSERGGINHSLTHNLSEVSHFLKKLLGIYCSKIRE